MTIDPASPSQDNPAEDANLEDSNQDYIQQLLSPERTQREDAAAILGFSGIDDGNSVADIGCGPGYYTVPLAKALSNGKVYALDVDEEMLEACRQRLAEARLDNVEVFKCGEYEFPLEDGSVDGLFIAFVLHHVEDRVRFLEASRRLLAPRGWCTLLEWDYTETEDGPPLERRIAPAELDRLTTEAGFICLDTRELNDGQYMVTLRNG